MAEIQVVTGAFGYSGRYITKRLLAERIAVRTLTNSPNRAHPFGERVEVFPFNFDDHEALVASLHGVTVLYNNYWVRFNHATFKQNVAVRNTIALFRAAREAGVRRVVHVSITNPSEESPLEYFRGKARLERALIESGLSYAILRPAVLFGAEDILVNNIAWMLRRFPVFGVFGDGTYRLQPIYVDDFAKLAIEQGAQSSNVIIDAIGPDTWTYRGFVELIGRIIGCPRRIMSVRPEVGYSIGWLLGKFVGDVIITRNEIEGLMNDLLYTQSTPVGQTKFSEWAVEHAGTLGIRYASELARREPSLRRQG